MTWEFQYKQSALEQMRICDGRNLRGECEYKRKPLTEEYYSCEELKQEGNCPIVTGV